MDFRGTFFRMRTLLRKEMIQLFKNPKMQIMLFVPPVVQLLVLGYAATMDLKVIDFAVLDHARSAKSKELIARFTGSGVFRRKPDFISHADMADRIARRDVKAALVIPEKFDRDLELTGKADVQVIADGRNSNTASLILGYARTAAEQFSSSGMAPQVRIISRAWFNPNYSAQYFMVPSLLATIALLDLMLLTALSFAREREDGTFDQLLLTPYSSAELLIAKGISCLLTGTLQVTIGLLFTLFWFRIPFMSSFFTLYLLFLFFMFAAIGLGLLISVLSADLNQAMMGAFIVSVPLVMLSGLATPVESMPDFFQYITLANPMRYGIEALRRIFLEGAVPSDLPHAFLILTAIGIVSSLLAYLIFQYQRKA